MSKSKSRHPSKAPSGSNRNGASGAARQASAANKTTVKSPVNDGMATTEKEKAASTATSTRQLSAASASTKSTPSTPPAAKQVPAANASTKPLSPATSKAKSRDAIKYERRQAERQKRYLAQRRARRNKILAWTSAVVLVAVLGGLGYWIYRSHLTPANATSSTSPSAYHEAIYNSSYPPVDNVYCDQLEGSVQHIHVHLTIYIDGQNYPLPGNVGIPQGSQGNPTCFYWLHVHPQYPGVIHIESPVIETFTLGQFLDEWDQYFSSLGFPNQLLLKSGWTIWINGHKYNGSLDSVPLDKHNLITIAYSSPKAKPDTVYNWNGL
jgi:hypothetical protein